MGRSKSWSWKETAVDVQVQHCFSQQLPLFYWFFFLFYIHYCHPAVSSDAQAQSSVCVGEGVCVCVHTDFNPHSTTGSSRLSFRCFFLLSLISYLWMNECTTQCSAQSVTLLLCLYLRLNVCVCAFHSCRRISRRLFMCFSSCLDPTVAPEWLTHPALSRLQCFHLFGDMVGVFVLLCFYPLVSQCAQTGSQDCRRLCV